MIVDDAVLVEVVRSGFVESVHRGRVAGLDSGGTVAVTAGRVGEPVLLRSCAKPLQAVGMLRAGLDLDGPELALACASHDGTDRHVAVARQILAGAGLDESALDNTPGLPLEPRAAAATQVAGGPDRVHQNCSGKHAAMIATCVVNGWPYRDGAYRDPAHPLQEVIAATVEALCGEQIDHVAVDGCGAPNFAVSIAGLARAFARIATAAPGSAEARVAAAMTAHPELVGGDDRPVTRLMRAVPGLVAKDGAEGVFAAAMPDGRAVAVKIADGAGRATVPVAIAALRTLGVDARGFADLAEPPVLGHGEPVGTIRALPSRG